MIGFELSEEQKQWQSTARDFVEKEIKTLAWKIDKGLIEEFHWPLINKMAQQGLLSLGVPEKFGGSGLDLLTSAIVVEELAVGDAGIAFTTSLNSFLPLMVAGTEEQKEEFIPLISNKEKPGLSAFALTEPNAGSDASGVITSARHEGKHYVLNGEKCFISNGDVATLYTVLATVDKAKGVRGITAFLVPWGTEGLSRGKRETKMGFHSNHTSTVVLNDVEIPEKNRLGEEGDGFKIAMKVIDVARVLSCGAVGVGIARAAYEAVLKFLKTHSNPKAVIGQQAISFQLADMLAAIEASRLLVWKSGWIFDRGLPAATMISLTKFYASDMAVELTNRSMQLVGLHGYSEDYPVDKYVRDAKLLQIYEGTNQISRLIVSRDILSN